MNISSSFGPANSILIGETSILFTCVYPGDGLMVIFEITGTNLTS